MHTPQLTLVRTLDSSSKALLVRILNHLGWVTVERDLAQARPLLEEALALSKEIGNDWESGYALNILGVIATRAGQYEQAKAFFHESMTRLRAAGDRWFSSRPILNLATALYQQGDYDAAWSVWSDGLTLFRELGDAWLTAYALGSLGDVERQRGHYAQAQIYYEESLTVLRKPESNYHIALPLGQLGYASRQQTEQAGKYKPLSRGMGVNHDLGYQVGIARSIEAFARLNAARAQPEIAARLFGAAAALREVLDVSLPDRERADHDDHLAIVRAHLKEETFAKAWAGGHALTMEQAIAELEHLISAAQTQSLSGSYLAGLTEREVEVLRWLAKGLTDEEIAEQLVLSRRTVHAHLRSIYSKLDVTTRSAATHIAIEYKLV